MRARGLIGPKTLDSEIVIIAAGSLGGWFVATVPYAFRRWIIIDPENFEPENNERHPLNLSSLGKPKASEMKQYLINEGVPADQIVVHIAKVQDVLEIYPNADLLVVSVDNQLARDYVNTFAIANKIPMIIGGVYPLGKGGRIMVLPTPNEVCYTCAESVMGDPEPTHEPAHDYSLDPSLLQEKPDESIPALQAPIINIASNMAMQALDILNNKEAAHKPKLIFQAFEPLPLYHLKPGENFQNVRKYVLSLADQGVEPYLEIVTGMAGNKREWIVKVRGTFTIPVEKWSMCPYHTKSVSVDDI